MKVNHKNSSDHSFNLFSFIWLLSYIFFPLSLPPNITTTPTLHTHTHTYCLLIGHLWKFITVMLKTNMSQIKTILSWKKISNSFYFTLTTDSQDAHQAGTRVHYNPGTTVYFQTHPFLLGPQLGSIQNRLLLSRILLSPHLFTGSALFLNSSLYFRDLEGIIVILTTQFNLPIQWLLLNTSTAYLCPFFWMPSL